MKGRSSLNKKYFVLGPNIWESLPESVKTTDSLAVFEIAKKWKPENCPSRLC